MLSDNYDMDLLDLELDRADALLDAALDNMFGMPDISNYDYLDSDFQGDGYDE